MTGLAKILARKSVMTDAPFSNCGNQEIAYTKILLESRQITKLVCQRKLSTATQTSTKRNRNWNICFETGFESVFYDNCRNSIHPRSIVCDYWLLLIYMLSIQKLQLFRNFLIEDTYYRWSHDLSPSRIMVYGKRIWNGKTDIIGPLTSVWEL